MAGSSGAFRPRHGHSSAQTAPSLLGPGSAPGLCLPGAALIRDRLLLMASTEYNLGRSSILDIVSYDLALDLTHGTEKFWSRSEVRFRCRQARAATFADVHAVSILRAKLNGADLDLTAGQPADRLELPRLADENTLTVEAEFAYTAEAAGLHHVTDPEDGSTCVYSKTSSHGAPRIYCCFDEQDLRATFTVSVRAPTGWSCLANAPVVSRPPEDGPGIWRFAPTAPIPPWLSSFCAGPYSGSVLLCERPDGRPLPVTVQAVQSATAILDPGRILELLRQSLAYYERNLGIPYPYSKCDLVFVPALPPLAYSVPGLIIMQDQILKSQQVNPDAYLATVIAHELAHAWIGGLVAMRRREEMWLDEALTTYISRIVLTEILPGITPWAASTSATLPDYAYAKDAESVMKLESLVGREAVIGGLRTLLDSHAHDSATKDELVHYWSGASGRDLRDWAVRTLIPAGGEENEPTK